MKQRMGRFTAMLCDSHGSASLAVTKPVLSAAREDYGLAVGLSGFPAVVTPSRGGEGCFQLLHTACSLWSEPVLRKAVSPPALPGSVASSWPIWLCSNGVYHKEEAPTLFHVVYCAYKVGVRASVHFSGTCFKCNNDKTLQLSSSPSPPFTGSMWFGGKVKKS